MRTIKITENKRIFGASDVGDEAYRILSGSVEIFIGEGKDKVVLSRLEAGEVFGEMGMIDGRPRSASSRALTEVQLEVITRDDFHQRIADVGDEMIPYLRAIFERLRVTNERLHDVLRQLRDDGSEVLEVSDVGSIKSEPGIQLRVVPDSDEMRAQSVLDERVIESFPFTFSRRAELAGTDVSMSNMLLIADSIPYRISRNHCLIEHRRGGFLVRDRSSRRGTLVNGIMIGGKSREKSLRLKTGNNSLVLGGPDSPSRFQLIVTENIPKV
ncbi:MAG: cyclic nucleotide-binding domain-containing protein [Opitutaceae bacterium]